MEWYKVIFEEINPNIIMSKNIEYKKNKKLKIKGKNKDFTQIILWDLPLDYSKQEISRLVKHFEYAEEIILKKLRFYQSAEIKIYIRGEKQVRKLKVNWVIGLENRKLAHMTIGIANSKSLKERKEYRATLTNISSIAQKTLLLRSL